MKHLLEPLDLRTHFDAGQLDSHFGTNGLTQINVPSTSKLNNTRQTPYLMATDTNGRTVIASFARPDVSGQAKLTTFRRLDPFGNIDAAFSASPLGQTLEYTGNLAEGSARFDFAVDGSNRIYVLDDKTLTRYTSSGVRDRSFGRRGAVGVPTLSDIADLDVTADGRAYVFGSAVAKNGGDTNRNALGLVKFNTDGTLDTSFATNGVYVSPPPALGVTFVSGGTIGEAMRVLADGSVVIAGSGNFDGIRPGETRTQLDATLAIKLTARGRLDLNYGTRGVAQLTTGTDVIGSNLAVLGVRGDGGVAVVVNLFSKDDDGTFSRTYRTGITAGGQVDSHEYSTLATAQPHTGYFIPAGDGADYFVNRDGLTKLVGGNVDQSFNEGQTLSIVTAASLANNGELTFAGTGSNAADTRYNVGRYYTSEGPTATLVPTALTAASRTFAFSVVYADDDGVDLNDLSGTFLNGQELRVRGPNYYARPQLVNTTISKGVVTANYVLRPTSGKSFTAANNGAYSVSLTGTAPRDRGGVAPAAGKIGTLIVNIANATSR